MLGWGEDVVAECDAVVFLRLDPHERIRRLRAREALRQEGRTPDPVAWEEFLTWASLDSAEEPAVLRDGVLAWEPC